MNKRVSTNVLFRRKCFIRTVPFGNVKSPSVPTPIVVPFGNASQRSFVASSDQNGAATSYGTSPLAGWLGVAATTQPVADNDAATGGPGGGAPPPSTILCKPPPLRSTT